jgi:replicative DNA helicase
MPGSPGRLLRRRRRRSLLPDRRVGVDPICQRPKVGSPSLVSAVRGVDVGEATEGSDVLRRPVPFSELLGAVLDAGPNRDDLLTGFADLDNLTGGLTPGSLWVVSGRSGAGKSVLVSDLVRSALRQGRETVLVTHESPQTVVLRIVAAESRVPLQHLNLGPLSAAEEIRSARARSKLADVPLQVAAKSNVDDMPLSFADASTPRLLVVDGVPAGRAQLAALADLKVRALHRQVAVVAVVQEDVDDPERQLRRIEQVADVALTVHRDDQHDRDSPRAGEADFLVTRHRAGPVSVITVAFQGHYGRFVDLMH